MRPRRFPRFKCHTWPLIDSTEVTAELAESGSAALGDPVHPRGGPAQLRPGGQWCCWQKCQFSPEPKLSASSFIFEDGSDNAEIFAIDVTLSPE